MYSGLILTGYGFATLIIDNSISLVGINLPQFTGRKNKGKKAILKAQNYLS